MTFVILPSPTVNIFRGGDVAGIWRSNLNFGDRYQQLRAVYCIVVNIDGICKKFTFNISSITYKFMCGTVAI